MVKAYTFRLVELRLTGRPQMFITELNRTAEKTFEVGIRSSGSISSCPCVLRDAMSRLPCLSRILIRNEAKVLGPPSDSTN